MDIAIYAPLVNRDRLLLEDIRHPHKLDAVVNPLTPVHGPLRQGAQKLEDGVLKLALIKVSNNVDLQVPRDQLRHQDLRGTLEGDRIQFLWYWIEKAATLSNHCREGVV